MLGPHLARRPGFLFCFVPAAMRCARWLPMTFLELPGAVAHWLPILSRADVAWPTPAHLSRLLFCVPAAMRRARWLPMISSRATMRSGAMAAKVPMIFAVLGPAWLGPCSPLTLSRLLCNGCLALWRDVSLYRLLHALAQRVPMTSDLRSSLAHPLLASRFAPAASRFDKMGADGVQC